MPSNWGGKFFIGGVQVYNFIETTGADATGLTLRTFSLMTDPEAWFDEDNLGNYSVFGIHYILTPSSIHPQVPVTLVRSAGRFDLWSVGTGGIFQVADTTTPIEANASDLGIATRAFLWGNLPGKGIYQPVAFAGQPAPTPTLRPGEHPVGPAGTVVSEVDGLFSGTASAVVQANRTSVVVLKASFDPGWSATVDGAKVTPEMVTPALLAVRVGPGRHVIVFTYHGYGSYPLLFGIAAVTLVAVGAGPTLWRRRRRATVLAEPGDELGVATD
jgi:hypothetical protein